jgi:GTP 3',8-cyclase
MKDGKGRRIDYLRVSVTDRCNLRCIYCMPEEGIPLLAHSQVLKLEEILQLVEVIHRVLHLRKIRITGGEPLVRKNCEWLVERVSQLAETVMTTNGVLLADRAPGLARAGLSRVNISLDSLRDEVLQNVTRRNVTLRMIEKSIGAARANGIWPVKINCVVQKRVNQGELASMVKWAMDLGVTVRFIEHMPMEGSCSEGVEGGEIIAEIEASLGRFEPVPSENRTAELYRNAQGMEFGLIAPLWGDLCSRCTRLRLTCEGKLLPCLVSGDPLDLGVMLRQGDSPALMEEAIVSLVKSKPAKGRCEGVKMWRIGG